jgi:REP element-mobilizing transposase RayT
MATSYHIKDPSALYFLTLTVIGWVDIFSRKIYRDMIIDNLDYCRKNKGLVLYAYVIMTNHLHIVARAKPGYKLWETIRDFKKFTSKEVKKLLNEPFESRREWMKMLFARAGKWNSNNVDYQFWKQDNHPIELYSNYVIDQKINYIHNNPVKAGFVEKPEDYIYSSARFYSGMDYILEIDRMQ